MRRLDKKVIKPWGSFTDLMSEKGAWHTKIITLKKGKRLSLQYHFKRCERWVLLEGKIIARKGKKDYILKAGDTIYLDKKELHRMTAIVDSKILEATFGLHDEKDIIRVEDDFNRES